MNLRIHTLLSLHLWLALPAAFHPCLHFARLSCPQDTNLHSSSVYMLAWQRRLPVAGCPSSVSVQCVESFHLRLQQRAAPGQQNAQTEWLVVPTAPALIRAHWMAGCGRAGKASEPPTFSCSILRPIDLQTRFAGEGPVQIKHYGRRAVAAQAAAAACPRTPAAHAPDCCIGSAQPSYARTALPAPPHHPAAPLQLAALVGAQLVQQRLIRIQNFVHRLPRLLARLVEVHRFCGIWE